MKHEVLNLYAITHRVEIPFMQDRMIEAARNIRFTVSVVAPNIKVVQLMDNLAEFEPIDARRVFVAEPIKDIKDFNIFARIGKTEQVLVDKADMSVIEHLEAIKKLQSDTQRELRQKASDRQAPSLIAQLVSYGDAA